MSVKLSEIQTDIIKNIALQEGFKNYEIIVTSGSKKGDGFLGIIASVTIKGNKGEVHLILKSAHLNKLLREKAPIVDVYHREVFIYEEVFPAFREFQKEYNVSNGFSAYAKIYGSSLKEYNECVILENLRETNYKLWNKKTPMNPEHLTSVFEEYGKLHATSLAMKSRKPELYKRLTERLEEMYTDADKILWEHGGKSMAQAGLEAVKGNDLATKMMEKLVANTKNFYYESFSVLEDRLVILHGDCWNNNMMFNYEESQDDDSSKPSRVCLLDWQLSRLGSPVVDLSYFFFVCASKEDLTQYQKYLKIYHNTLAHELSKFSCDVETIFPYPLLETHWKRYCKFGTYMAMLVIKVMLSEEEEYPDLEEIAKEGLDNIKKKPASEFSHVEEYNQRIIDIVTIMSENGLI